MIREEMIQCIKDERWQSLGIFLGGMSPWAHLPCTHRNVASRPQRGLKDSSGGPFLSCSEHSINEHYYYCCCYYSGYDYAEGKT